LYAVPYLWTEAGLGYNVDEVRERLGSAEPNSWSLLFDPKNAAKLKDCGIMIVDSPEDVLPSVLIYLGKDPPELKRLMTRLWTRFRTGQ
jgi:putrescine transport system substrate-binding protein